MSTKPPSTSLSKFIDYFAKTSISAKNHDLPKQIKTMQLKRRKTLIDFKQTHTSNINTLHIEHKDT